MIQQGTTISISSLTPTPSVTPELNMTSMPLTATPFLQSTSNPTATYLPPISLLTASTTCEFNPQNVLSPSDPLKNVILFISNSREPLTNMNILSEISHTPSRRYTPQLWAISPDGQKANRLTIEGHGVTWHLPETSNLPMWLMSSVDFTVDETLLWQIPLPEVCDDFLENDYFLEEYKNLYHACGDFEISPDGKWASFQLGDYLTGYNVQSGLINLETGEMEFSTIGTGLMQFLPNNERLVFNSWGEGGELWWANSLTGEAVRLGEGGFTYWNLDETAFAVEWFPYVGVGGAVWAYYVPTKNLFTPESSPDALTTHPVWSPDGLTLLYQQQAVITRTSFITLTLGPSEVYMADIVTGEDRVVLSDPQSNYYLCDNRNVESCVWADDWIRVRRLPYHMKELYFEDYDLCVLYGSSCPDSVENLAFNWRTGELIDWETVTQQRPTSTAVPLTAPIGPDLATEPIYTDMEMGYALYSGHDGSSLWCVPDGGVPQLWIQDAEWIAYLP